MKKLFLVLLFLGFVNFVICQSYTNYRPLNFECGGWVTEIVPFPDKNHTITNPNNSILFARTDVGGVYYSSNNGSGWNYISTYFDNKSWGPEFSPSFLNIQGIAVHPENPDIVLVAWGLDENDAKIAKDLNNTVNYQCLWKSVDHGNNWTKPYITSPGVWFKGNDNNADHYEKLGGECIIFSPYKNGSNYKMYMGGVPRSGYTTTLFESYDEGNNWSAVSSFSSVVQYPNDEIITSITMKDGTNYIWVGTSHNLYVSENLGGSWQRVLNTYENMNIKRIIFGTTYGEKKDQTVAFITFGNGGAVGVGKVKKNLNGLFDFYAGDLTYQFDLGVDPQQDRSTHFSTLLFPYKTDGSGIDYNHLVAGRYGRPIRESFGDGTNEPGGTWGGYYPIWGCQQIVLQYGVENIYPNHQYENEPFIYTGLNNLTQNPNFPDHWYSSGGAGAFKSDNVNISTNAGQSFSNLSWKYMTTNMTMPVVLDITFNTTNNLSFFPIADWILGYSNYFGNNFSVLSYDRRGIYNNYGNEYTSFATRSINCILQGNENRSYILGCYQYGNGKATFYWRDQNGSNVTYTKWDSDPLVNRNDRFFTDGLQYPCTQNGITVNRICALVGQQSGKVPPDPNDINKLGIYLSDNEGQSWFPGSFTGLSDVPGVSAQQAYNGALLPGLNGFMGGIFDEEFNLANDGTYLYLYLEGGTGVGGVFNSLINSTNGGGGIWNLKPDPPVPGGYKDQGCIKADITTGKLYLAIKGNPSVQRDGGLFYSTDQANNWTAFNGWKEATCVEAKGQNIAAFGRRINNGNEDLNKVLYKSSDGGQTWNRITDLPLHNSMTLMPRVTSLRIRPDRPNELWIATSGEGVIVYDNFGDACPLIVSNYKLIDQSTYTQNCDIQVEEGGFLEIKNCSNFKMGANTKIWVKPGGQLTCSNTTFTGNGGNWLGIDEDNSIGITIDNCIFSDAVKSVSVKNGSYSKSIRNSTINVPSVTEACAITCTDIINCSIYNNTLNLLGGLASGIIFNIGVSYLGDQHTPTYLITKNNFTGGSDHLRITCTVDNLPPFYIESNQFISTSNGDGSGFYANKIFGYFKYNTFGDNQFTNAITLSESFLFLYQNTIKSKSTNLMETNLSNVFVEPLTDGNGNYLWRAGKNIFDLQNDPATNDLCNIDFADGCTLNGKEGNNCFYLTNDVNNYHIYDRDVSGTLSDFTSNYWSPMPPHIYGSVITDHPLPDCIAMGQISSNYDAVNISNGYNDTIFITSTPGGGGQRTEEINPKYFFTEIQKQKRLKHYSDAINYAKQIINNYDTSKYFLAALDELYSNYLFSDTINNQGVRYSLFNSLKTYLEQKIQQYQNKPKFVDKAYRFYLMSKTKMKNYQEVLTGYENIISNHPDPIARLTASWDRASVILLMNGNGSGGQKEDDTKDFETRFMKLMKEKPVHETAKETFSGMKQDYNDRKSNGLISKSVIENNKKIEKRISVFIPKNKKELNKKINDDINVLLGLKKSDSKNNKIIPKEYSLSQNYPNPFNPNTKINYELPKDGKVKLVIYDILGREMKVLVNELKQAGRYIVEFNGNQFASGVYFYRIQVDGGKGFTAVKKMVLIK